jgi:putative FmdB family regulatory protein
LRVRADPPGAENMPIYDYICSDCQEAFEAWVRKEKDVPACPSCEGANLEKQLSMPQVHSAGTKARSMKAAKKRDASQAAENTYTQQQYELNHDDH